MIVPSSGFLSRPAGVPGSSREVELLEEEDVKQRIVSLTGSFATRTRSC